MTSDLNLIQYFKEITNTLTNLEKPVNVFDFAFEKAISSAQAQFALNSFILQSKEISKFIIIFRAEISEFDEIKKIEKTKIQFFPSNFKNLENLLVQASSQKFLDFGVYCIFKKIEDFALYDFGVFAHEMRKKEILDLNEFHVVSSNSNVKGNLSSVGFGSKIASKQISACAAGNNLEKNFKEKVNISKAADATKNTQKPLASSNAPSTNKNSVSKEEIKSKGKSTSNQTSGNIKGFFTNANKPATPVPTAEISLNNNNNLYDIDEGDEAEIYNFTSSCSKQEDLMEIEEINEISKQNKKEKEKEKTKENLSKNKKAEISKIDSKPEKRKNNLAAFSSEENNFNNNNNKPSKMKPESKFGNNESSSNYSEEMQLAHNAAAAATKEKQPNEPKKKIKKTRKVKKTKTYKDEDGFDVTSEYLEDEEYWTDEKSEASAGNNFKSNLQINANKPSAGAAAAKRPAAAQQGKKGAGNQKSLEMFFKK